MGKLLITCFLFLSNFLLSQEENQQSFMWGNFKIIFSENQDDKSSLQIWNPKGRLVKTIDAPHFITPSLVEKSEFNREFLLPLFKNKEKILKITAWTGGAYGAYTDYLFQQYDDGTIKNIFSYAGGEARIGKAIEDYIFYTADGKPHLVIVDFDIQKLGALQHGASTKHILSWDGRKFIDTTRQFKQITSDYALTYKTKIKGPISEIDANLESILLGYLANSILAGDELKALTWLKGQFSTLKFFRDFESQYLLAIKKSLKNFNNRLSYQ